MSAVMTIKPKSVIDIGCGNLRKYGFLIQEYMRYWMGIEEPHIDAIEIFDPYWDSTKHDLQEDHTT